MSEVVKNKKRYGVMRLTDALGYRLPLAGFVSILHRASGHVDVSCCCHSFCICWIKVCNLKFHSR